MLSRTRRASAPRRLALPVLAAVATLGLGFAGCASKRNFYQEYETRLDGAWKALMEAEDPERASREAEGLLAETGAAAQEFRLQRYYAIWLLAQAHVRASLGHPFLPEPPAPLSALSLGGSSAGKERAESAHVVATMLYASYGTEALAGARGAPAVVDDTELLPPALREIPPDVVAQNLDLCRLVVYARLGFIEDIHGILSRSPEIHTLEKCTERIEQARLDPGLRPWVYYTLFDFLKTRDEPEAFRFGVRSWSTARDAAGTLSAAQLDDVAEWLPATKTYVFKCKQCKLEADPEMLRLGHCRNDQTPLLDFFPDRTKS